MMLCKKKTFYISLLIISFINCSIFSKQKYLINSKNTDPKVLILIIASDNYPGLDLTFPYPELKKIWRAYMHTYPDNIEAYFIQGDPNLSSPYEIQEDIIWSKTEENVKPGVLNKTILSIECMLPRIHEFDYVLRTNLSSFYVFPRLLNFLKKLPKSGCYCGYPLVSYAYEDNRPITYAHGCGFIMSPDVATYLVNNQDILKKTTDFHRYYDDIVIGEFFKNSGIDLIPAPIQHFVNIRSWKRYQKKKSPATDFHFRVKNNEHKLRESVDVYILSCLLQQFYGLASKEYGLKK